jgi:hypothetical protein
VRRELDAVTGSSAWAWLAGLLDAEEDDGSKQSASSGDGGLEELGDPA